VPAAAVIPAPLVYIIDVAVETSVVALDADATCAAFGCARSTLQGPVGIDETQCQQSS
jgi:hypothetical protein